MAQVPSFYFKPGNTQGGNTSSGGFDPRIDQVLSKSLGRPVQTPEQRSFQKGAQVPMTKPQAPQTDPLDDILGRLEKETERMNKIDSEQFTFDLQRKLLSTLDNHPSMKALQANRKQLMGEEQTRFQSELGEGSETLDPLVQLDAASQSRRAVSESLADVQTAIESGTLSSQQIVNNLLNAEALKAGQAKDRFQRQRELLADTLDVRREKRIAAEAQRGSGGGGSGSGVSDDDEVELINLALDSMTKEERQQIELLPTASRKQVLIQRGREIQKQKQAQRQSNAAIGIEGEGQLDVGGTIVQGLTDLVTGKPLSKSTIQLSKGTPKGQAPKTQEVTGIDDIANLNFDTDF